MFNVKGETMEILQADMDFSSNWYRSNMLQHDVNSDKHEIWGQFN